MVCEAVTIKVSIRRKTQSSWNMANFSKVIGHYVMLLYGQSYHLPVLNKSCELLLCAERGFVETEPLTSNPVAGKACFPFNDEERRAPMCLGMRLTDSHLFPTSAKSQTHV